MCSRSLLRRREVLIERDVRQPASDAFAESCRPQEAQAKLDAMLDALRTQQLSVSFETMARCLHDHGQRPHGDYLVVTSVCRMPHDGTIEVRACATCSCTSADCWLAAQCT